ncbi:hypothetical protein DFA_06717 [Cavenderia fasciculata]|uniref:Uncharacterized protein n=1 Tax=Cavenderia fasciculata TaxID=261658 RepID=F4Q230_CACFS|nr:uncharacterized protein DFA_06717 [Cavenderia fasciculata]EGG18050.1 hypothetical protein DFA_06717 [Cavenderia fasciculata]|eukprot:XP_004356943.1 hypothetical protein DFA_06717 [Cavenderia fasciculata]
MLFKSLTKISINQFSSSAQMIVINNNGANHQSIMNTNETSAFSRPYWCKCLFIYQVPKIVPKSGVLITIVAQCRNCSDVDCSRSRRPEQCDHFEFWDLGDPRSWAPLFLSGLN